MKTLRVLALMHKDLVPPESLEGLTDKQIEPMKVEYDVVSTLHNLGHDYRALGVEDDLGAIRQIIQEHRPHVVFNLMEEFGGFLSYVPFVLGYLELIKVPYTGCNPRGMILSRNKALMRKILKHHRIPMPDFMICPRGRVVRRARRLQFPLIVKSASEHGSAGIAQASVVRSDDKLAERVAYVHQQMNSDALVEEYVEGREFYVGVMGHRRLQTLPVWEITFGNLADGASPIATAKVKWDLDYQKRSGISTGRAKDLPNELEQRLANVCKRVYRILELSSYARMDLRVTPEGRIYLLEPNPNPDIAFDEDFAMAAAHAGMPYEKLIQRILRLGMSYRARWD